MTNSNPNNLIVCGNCSHSYKDHTLVPRDEWDESLPAHDINDIPWVCLEIECDCRKYVPIKV